MGQPTCSVESCDGCVCSKGMCSKHYQRMRKTGRVDRPCLGCGKGLDGNRKYCSDECRPRCRVGGCADSVASNGMCSTHASRGARHGDPHIQVRFAGRECVIDGCGRKHDSNGLCSTHASRVYRGKPVLRPCVTCGRDVVSPSGRDHCGGECHPACSEPGCERPKRSRGLCAAHYDDLLRFEQVGKPRAYRWATEKKCVVCGATEWSGKRRKVCSGRCQQLLQRNGGQPPPSIATCGHCGDVIDLTEASPRSGRKKRADTRLCHWCKRRRSLRHKVSVSELVRVRGVKDCAICSEPVDLSLRSPDLFRASIDHIVPYSHGGTHDLDNLQVVHLYCNYLKSDREGFTL